MEKLFCIALVSGLVVAVFLGRGQAAFTAALSAADEAVTLSLGLIGACALWGGLARMAEGAGLSRALARWLRRPLGMLFPGTKPGDAGREAVATAMSANLLGLGNASTPLGIAAMKALGDSACPCDADTFWLISASALQVLPTTVIAMRQAAGAQNAADILPVCIIASLVSTLVAIVIRPRGGPCKR
nr:nucleoside recognition protein [bacterium]